MRRKEGKKRLEPPPFSKIERAQERERERERERESARERNVLTVVGIEGGKKRPS